MPRVGQALVALVSYGCIIAAIMKIHSTQGQIKAFNICASHPSTVILVCGSCLSSYLHAGAGLSWDQYNAVSVIYRAVIPVLNLIVYSLQNQEIKDALKKLKRRKKHMCSPWVVVP